MAKIKSGEYVIIHTSDSITLTGLLMPDSTEKRVILKLNSGYNVGINKSRIKSMEKTKAPAQKQAAKPKKLKIDKKRPTVSVLHTGGTIASRVDYNTGAVTARFSPEELVEMFPEIKELANIDSKLIRNMWSGDMNFNHHNLIAKAVQKEIKKGVSGVIITQGTDTISYTAAALSFILEGLSIPVIIVGSQRSSDRGSSDAFLNLSSALRFITESDFAGVAICMHASSNDKTCHILPACKTKKLHSSRRDAFKAVNATPIAEVSEHGIEFFHNDHKRRGEAKLKLKELNPKLKIGIVRAHPHMRAEELSVYEKYHGLIIEGTGLGHMPVDEIDEYTKENTKILRTIKKIAAKAPVIMTTQCMHGRVNMNVYAYGRKLQEAGVLGNHTDLLAEAAFIKLAWLLSHYTKKEIPHLWNENFHGELNKKSQYFE